MTIICNNVANLSPGDHIEWKLHQEKKLLAPFSFFRLPISARMKSKWHRSFFFQSNRHWRENRLIRKETTQNAQHEPSRHSRNKYGNEWVKCWMFQMNERMNEVAKESDLFCFVHYFNAIFLFSNFSNLFSNILNHFCYFVIPHCFVVSSNV